MQRVTNCLYLKDNKILLLQKPRRGWWAIPGGKMEPGETVKEAAIREFFEETGITLNDPVLKGIYTFLIKDGQTLISEWMMFTFLAKNGAGIEKIKTEEGILEWHPVEAVAELPMAEGDRSIIHHALSDPDVRFGLFEYTEDFQLLTRRMNG